MANGLKNSLKFVAAGIALSSASAAFATCGNNGCGTTTPPKPTTPTQPTQPIYNTPSAGAAAGANAGAAAGAQAGAQSGSLSGAAASNQADLKASQTANQNTQVGVGVQNGVNSSNKNDLAANAAGGAAKSDANATGGAAKSDSSAVAGDSAAQAKTGDVTVGGTNIGGSKSFTFVAGNLPGVAGSAISGPAVVQLCQTSHSKDTGGVSFGLGGATPNGGALNLGYSKKGETINDVKPDEKCYEAFMAHEKAMADKAHAAAQSQATVALDRDMLNKGPVGMALVVEKNYKDQAAAITAKDSPTAKLMGLFAQPTTKPVVKKPAAKKDPCVKSVNVCKPQ